MRSSIATLVAAFGAVAAASVLAQADYPSKPIRVITIASAGAGGDAITRLLTEKMAPLLKASFVVDNKPGAGGALAMDALAKSPPDGYTIGLGGFTSNVLLPIVKPRLSYDAVKDFAPIGQIGTASILLVATNDFPASNLKGLIAAAKQAPPDSLMYGSWGIASTGHFCGELLNQRAGIKLAHVPYKGTGPLQNDLMGGQIQLATVDMATATPLVKAGRIKAIAACVTRSPSLPDVRSYVDDGIDISGKSSLAPMWTFYAPAGTPKPIVDKLSAALKKVIETPEMKAKLLEFGVTADFVPGDKFRQLLASGIPQWKEIATNSKIQLDD